MNQLLQIAIVNAITVIPLAVVAGLVAWRCNWAALRHAVWVLVLLKFVTPPLFSLPMNLAVLPAPVVTETVVLEADAGTFPSTPAQWPAVSDSASDRLNGKQDTIEAATSPGKATVHSSIVKYSTLTWSTMILTAWLAGSVVWLGLQVLRAIRFETLITYRSSCPDELQSQCSELAHQLGILRAPRVCVIDAAISPMLWGLGSRAKLLFPAKLAARMNAESRATLLMHELAHFSRGDHFVRVLELFATGLFWWHPLLWVARRQIEQSEEECCDAWVVQQFPKSPRRYAEALLDTIDFLCESRRALPPLASGLGHAPFLRRRLTQIMQGTTIPPLTRATRWGLLLCAGLLLPIQPFVLGAARLNRDVNSLPTALVTPAASPFVATSIESDPTEGPESLPDISPSPPPKVLPRPQERLRPRPQRTRKQGEVWSTAVSSDGRFIIRISTKSVTLTDMQYENVFDLSPHKIVAVAFSPDGRWFVSAGRDGRVIRWNAVTAEVKDVLLQHDGVLNTVAVSPEGDRVAAGGRSGQVILLDLIGEAAPKTITAPAAVNCVRFSPSGENLAVGCGDWMASLSGQVVLYDTHDWKITHRKTSVSMGAIAFASDEELILGGWTGRVQLWNLASDEIVAEGDVNKNVVSAASFSPDNPSLREAVLLPAAASSAPDTTFSFLRSLLETVP